MNKAEGLPSPEEAVIIQREKGCSVNVINHCKAVAKVAVRIANRCVENGVSVNVRLVQNGALLHDLGRSETQGIRHAVVGADIARSLKLPEPIIAIIERHIGGGITAQEAAGIGLPVKSYMPVTIEEKIVSYADKLVEGNRVVRIEETVLKLREELGTDHPAAKRVMALHREISALCLESDD